VVDCGSDSVLPAGVAVARSLEVEGAFVVDVCGVVVARSPAVDVCEVVVGSELSMDVDRGVCVSS